MPEPSTVELHCRLYQAFNERDVAGLVELSDPRIRIESVFGAVSGGVYHGYDGVRRWQADLEEAWGEELRVEVEAYFDLGEHALAFDALHGRGRQSGAEVTLPGAAVTRWRSGQCVYFKAYANREDPLRDLGVTEDALKPSSFGN